MSQELHEATMFARGSRLLQYSHLTPNFAKSQTLAPLFHYQQTRPVLANSHRHYASSPKFDVNNNKTEMKQEWSQELIQVTQQVVDLTKADKLTTTQCNSLIRNLRQLEEYNKMFKVCSRLIFRFWS